MEDEPLHYKRVKHFDTPAHLHFLTFSCFKRQPLLTNDLWRGWLVESIRTACTKYTLGLWAYVFMPEHVHLLLQPLKDEYSVSEWLKSIKNSLAKRVISDLQKQQSPLLENLKIEERPGKGSYRFWQAGPGYDKNIWSMDKAIEKARYCHRNPITRGLVRNPEDWKWSSYRWVELGARKDEPLKVDDWVG